MIRLTLLITTLLGMAALPPVTQCQVKSLETLQKEVDSLKVKKVAWRGIAWKTCLLDGLQASRKDRKPLMLWIFIDRPIDDERC